MRARAVAPSLAHVVVPVIFLVCAAFEVSSVVTGHPWHGFSKLFSDGTSVFLALLWTASAVIIASRTKLAPETPMFGVFLMLAWGIVARAGGTEIAVVYLGLAPIVAMLEYFAILSVFDPEHLAEIDQRDVRVGVEAHA